MIARLFKRAKDLFRPRTPLSVQLDLWIIHGVGSDVLDPVLRPEFQKFVNEARGRKPDADAESLIAETLIVLREKGK